MFLASDLLFFFFFTLPTRLKFQQSLCSQHLKKKCYFSTDLMNNAIGRWLCTLAIFAVSLQEEHVCVDGALLHVLLHSLNKSTVRRHRSKISTPDGLRQSTNHFRVSSIDDDACAIRCGSHLTGRTWARGGAWWGEARPGERVQREGVDVIVVDKIPAEGGGRVDSGLRAGNRSWRLQEMRNYSENMKPSWVQLPVKL